jgi:putative ABC transport system permease protein
MSLRQRLRVWRLRLRSIARKDDVDTQLARELRFHFDALVDEHEAEGMSPADARRAAHRAFGNVASLEEACRDERRVTWVHDLRQDVTYGLRMLRKQPGFTVVAAASLALGIGTNAAVLGALDAIVLRELPVPQADRLVAIQAAPLDKASPPPGLSLAEYAAYRDRARSFATLDAAIRWASDLGGDGRDTPPERVQGQLVTAGWLRLFGIEPELGRVFTEEESRPSQPPVMVISDGFWRRRFGGDPHVLNTTVRVNGSTRTIIGVMPAEFRYQNADVDFWMPLYVAPHPQAGARLFGVRGRLKPGVTMSEAQAEMDGLAAELAVERPAHQQGWGADVRPLKESLFGWAREPLLTFEAAVALVLLIGCANVAALLLSRGSARQREIAMRVALGAGRARIVRQLLTESVLLAIVGGALGVFVAELALRAVVSMTTPPGSPPLAVGLNWHVVGLLALLTLGTGVACGVAPALLGSGFDPIGSFKDAAPAAEASGRRGFPRGALVSAQLALALILLIGSGLLLNSFVRLVGRDLNFVPDGLVRLDFTVPSSRYAKPIGSYGGYPYFEINPAPSANIQRVLDRLRALPGVESAGGISAPPVDAFVLATVQVRLTAGMNGSLEPPSATYFIVTPNLFATIGTPIVRGREFTGGDVATSAWAAIVNETAARRFWPGDDPIGKRLTLDIVPQEQAREVVGVVRDIPTRHAEDPQPVVYASFLQQPARYRAPWAGLPGSMTFLLRATGDPAALVPAARRAVAEVEPDRPLAAVSTVDAHMSNAMAEFRYSVVLVGVFAGMATLLAAIGTYGVMAYTVSQRRREIGIRIAIGAAGRDVVGMIMRQGLSLVIVGAAIGVGGALAASRLLRGILYSPSVVDPVTFAGVPLLLTAVAALASWLPAKRASGVDPLEALRQE